MDQYPRQDRTDPQPPLPEWQRDTWISPYPMEESPFDEPEDAPELRNERSEELNNRSGEFWAKQNTGYQFGREEAPSGGQQKAPEKKTRRKGQRGRAIAAALAGTTALFLLLHFGLFTVRRVSVQGNSRIPAAEVIRRSGISVGMPIFGLDEAAIERGIEQEPLLKFRYLEKDLPSTVILRVEEREACCWMTWNGILYIMDKQRTVLSESETIPAELTGGNETDEEESEKQEKVREQIAGLVRVDGLKVRSGALPGQSLVLENPEQQVVFSSLFLELKVLGCSSLMAEADLSNLDSLLLTTRDGFTVAMGNSMYIHAKLRSMLITREELLRRGYHGGVINVSLPETPIFTPQEV